MEGIIKNIVVGKFRNYTELKAELGYCFYDADLSEEERNYMTSISTPILDEVELENKFIAVKGNAEELNIELDKQRNNVPNNNDIFDDRLLDKKEIKVEEVSNGN